MAEAIDTTHKHRHTHTLETATYTYTDGRLSQVIVAWNSLANFIGRTRNSDSNEFHDEHRDEEKTSINEKRVYFDEIPNMNIETYKLWSIEAQITDSFELMISSHYIYAYVWALLWSVEEYAHTQWNTRHHQQLQQQLSLIKLVNHRFCVSQT